MCFGLCRAILRKRSALPVLVERSPCSRPKRKADWPLFKTCSVIGELALHMTSPRVHLLPMGLVCFRIRCISVDIFSTKPHSSAVSEVTVVNTWLFQSTFTSLMEDSQSLILAGIELSSAGLMGSLRPARSPGCLVQHGLIFDVTDHPGQCILHAQHSGLQGLDFLGHGACRIARSHWDKHL